MYGRYTFGAKPRHISKMILPYQDKKGYPIHEGKINGILYQIWPDKQASRMGDEFQYKILADGRESCSMDDVLIGYAHRNEIRKVPPFEIEVCKNKVPCSGLDKIIKEINPNSKII